ncbi:MAG: tetratricopeptide repeat protein [Planctomycetota bacterium]
MTRRAWGILACASLAALVATPAGAGDPAPRRDAAPRTLDAGVRELWRESIAAPPDATDADTRDHLAEAIRRLRVLRLGTARAVAGETATQPAEDAGARTGGRSGASAQTGTDEATTRPSRLDAATLETLRTEVAADSVADPLALADMLFKGGHLQTAAAFYRIALRRDPAPDERAWILLQTGNCLRRTDPGAARAAYKRVAAEHADSTWAPMAEAYEALLAWRSRARPDDLLAEIGRMRPAAGETVETARAVGEGDE